MKVKTAYYLEGKISRNNCERWDMIGEPSYDLDFAKEYKAFYESMHDKEFKHGWDGEFRIIEVTEKIANLD